MVLAANSDVVKTAIVCPPTIYGPGRGQGNARSKRVYNLVKTTLEKGQAPQLGKGLTEWDNVNVHDLSDLFVLLVEAAIGEKKDDPEIWGRKGYFLAENIMWGEVSKQVAEETYKQGYIKTKEVQPMRVDEAKETAGFEASSWGLNSLNDMRRGRGNCWDGIQRGRA